MNTMARASPQKHHTQNNWAALFWMLTHQIYICWITWLLGFDYNGWRRSIMNVVLMLVMHVLGRMLLDRWIESWLAGHLIVGRWRHRHWMRVSLSLFRVFVVHSNWNLTFFFAIRLYFTQAHFRLRRLLNSECL